MDNWLSDYLRNHMQKKYGEQNTNISYHNGKSRFGAQFIDLYNFIDPDISG